MDLYYSSSIMWILEALMLAEKMLNVRLPQELAAQLEILTKSTGRTKSALTVEALRGYLEAENWQIADIQAGVEEANRGEFASTEEVKAFFAKYDC
jgi:RHH-type transcriptional regulator, rel operon repressor / antitoxin RelB